MERKDKFDYESIKKKTLEQLRSGKSLFGKDGAESFPVNGST